MSILFLYRIYPNFGGVEVVTTVLANKFIEDGHNVTIVSFEQGNKELLEQLKSKVVIELLDYPIVSARNMKKLHTILVNHKTDVLINQWGLPFKTTLLCAIAMKGTQCRLISVLHGAPNTSKIIIKAQDKVQNVTNPLCKLMYRCILKAKEEVIKWSIRYAVKHNEYYVLLSKGFIQPLIDYAKIRDVSNILAISNPVTVPVDLRGFSLDHKKKQLLYVGRMDYENKRVNRIIEAWETIFKFYIDWELVLVGDGPHKKSLIEYVSENNIERVRFEGFRKDPPVAFYKDASIFLLTSDLEGFGLVIIESMSYGVVPIVYGSYEAVYDIVRDGVSGFITPVPYRMENTIERLRLLIDDQEMRKKMAKEAMNDGGRFTINSISAEWYKIFGDVINH